MILWYDRRVLFNLMKKPNFPYAHRIVEETKTIEVLYTGGYIGRIGVPKLVEKYFPGYKYVFVKE